MEEVVQISRDQIKQIISRVERLEQDKAVVTQDIKEVYDEAKMNGFDVKILKQIVKLRKIDQDDRAEQEALLDTYKDAIGMM